MFPYQSYPRKYKCRWGYYWDTSAACKIVVSVLPWNNLHPNVSVLFHVVHHTFILPEYVIKNAKICSKACQSANTMWLIVRHLHHLSWNNGKHPFCLKLLKINFPPLPKVMGRKYQTGLYLAECLIYRSSSVQHVGRHFWSTI